MNTDIKNKINTAKIAMVPVMLQTIYNTKKALSYIRDGRGDMVDNGNCFGAINDCNVIIEAFDRIGEKVPFRKRKFSDGRITLRHLKYDGNGEVVDIPKTLTEFKESSDAKKDERVEELKKGVLNAKAEAIAYRNLVKRDGWVPNEGDTLGKMVKFEVEKLRSAIQKLDRIVEDLEIEYAMKDSLKDVEEARVDVTKALTRISYWDEYTQRCLSEAKNVA